MYVYYDKNGVLKEIINDEALRQGNYNVNKIYVYIEDLNYSSIDASFLLPSGATVGPQNSNTFVEERIPFDQKRDLRYFNYNDEFRFCVIDLEPDAGDTEETEGDYPLQEAGVVHCQLTANTSDSAPVLGELNFNVEVSPVYNTHYVAEEQYLSLANYLFLRNNMVTYTNQAHDLDLGNHYLKFGSNYSIYYHEGDLWIATGNGNIHLSPDEKAYYGSYEIATVDNLPKKNVVGTFNTSSATSIEQTKVILVDLSGYIANSDLFVITWGGCFAICPIPQSGAGRVCAALWNANGESEITRIRYQLIQSNTKLKITLPGSFQLPDNFTGYVINYKLV